MSPVVFIRHGVASNEANLSILTESIEQLDFVTNNETYDWKVSIIDSGLKLAEDILSANEKVKQIALVGHSQGGLVCRIAALALKGQRRPDAKAGKHKPQTMAAVEKISHWQNLHSDKIQECELKGVLLLATPNGGALTYGQFSTLGRLALRSVTAIGQLFGVQDLQECVSDELFRVVQFFKVPAVPYTSISGSAINRYSAIDHGMLNELPGVSRLGPYLDKPNDCLVEDSSVDMEQAPLPIEVETGYYKHIRQYIDCIDVSHTGIHENEQVLAIVGSELHGWLKS